jgi:hypothetical protein
MSIERTETVDASVVRDGWAVLSIHHFGDWDELEELAESLRRKLLHYLEFVESPTFLERAHRMPARIELVCASPPPAEIVAMCETYGVRIQA